MNIYLNLSLGSKYAGDECNRGQVRLYILLLCQCCFTLSHQNESAILYQGVGLFFLCIYVSVWSTEPYQLSVMIVAPISSGTPRISRSNSIGPPSDSACDLYGSSPLGSSMSLVDRPKSMMRSGSFREPGEDGESV